MHGAKCSEVEETIKLRQNDKMKVTLNLLFLIILFCHVKKQKNEKKQQMSRYYC